MTTKIDAVYQDGVLKPLKPLALADGTQVEVLVISDNAKKSDKSGPAPKERRTPAEIMAEIAALPMQSGGKEFSGRDHDKILYGENGAR